MSSLVVGGVVIPVAVSSPSFSRLDAVDRGRMFDNTYYASQTGGAAREWDFSTPPVSTTDAATYSTILGRVASQLCSGDILELPIMCCSEFTGGTPVRTAVGHRVVLNFRLYEVQPARALLRYTPGNTIAGEAFTRSTVAYQMNNAGNLASVAIDTKRDGHYPANGVRSLLLEGTRTNVVLWNRDITNAAWTKVNMTTAHTSLGADGGASGATRLTATAGNATALQGITLGSSARLQSAYIKRITGTGSIQMTTDNGGTWTTVTTSASYAQLSIPVQTLANPTVGFRIVTSGDAIDVDFVQNENGTFASSPIATTTVAVTRGADAYSLPFVTPPQEMTVYAKFAEKGTKNIVGARSWQIGNAADGSPRFLVYAPAGLYAPYHNNGSAGVTVSLAAAPAIDDTVEHSTRLFGDGSVDITQSINAAATTSGAQTAANALASAWAGQLLWLNSSYSGGDTGFTAIQSFKIVAGVRGLAEMRTL